jgi:hypothetical protein
MSTASDCFIILNCLAQLLQPLLLLLLLLLLNRHHLYALAHWRSAQSVPVASARLLQGTQVKL